MSHNDFVLKMIEYQAELNKAIFLLNYNDIEYWSKKIGKLIIKFLGENKITIDK